MSDPRHISELLNETLLDISLENSRISTEVMQDAAEAIKRLQAQNQKLVDFAKGVLADDRAYSTGSGNVHFRLDVVAAAHQVLEETGNK